MNAQPTDTSARTARHGAFTLIELLVVIGVVALLVGLLVPSLAGARSVARSATCSANLRQWALAANTYTGDNKGYLPRRGQGVQPTWRIDRESDWFNALPIEMGQQSLHDLAEQEATPQPGDRSVWICPEAGETDRTLFFAYGMNMRLSTWEGALPDRIDGVGPMSAQVFMAEGPGAYCAMLPSSQPYSAIARHKGGGGSTNLAYLDAHVAKFSGKTVGCGMGDPQRAEIMWVVPNSPWSGPPS